MARKLENKVAVITAAGQGIGAASARIMAEQGAAVIVADINEAGARETAKAICDAGGRALGLALDVRDERSIKSVIETAHREFGRLDILHNNAGGCDGTGDHTSIDIPQDTWNNTLSFTLNSVFWGCRHAIPLMIAGGGGSIINTVSAAANFAQSVLVAYGTAKAAVAGLTRHVAVQHGPQNIRCNGISPGLILSPGVKAVMPPAIQKAILKHVPTPRGGKPEDIGHLAAFLASDDASYINGQVISVDGGIGVRFPHDAEMAELMANGL